MLSLAVAALFTAQAWTSHGGHPQGIRPHGLHLHPHAEGFPWRPHHARLPSAIRLAEDLPTNPQLASPNPARRAEAELARREEEDRKRQVGARLRRLVRPFFFSAAVAAALLTAAPPRGVLTRALCGTACCVLPGLVDGHLAVSYGYGLSMVWLALGVFRSAAGSASTRALLAAFVLYGVKVLIFQGARDARPEYVEKALARARERSPVGFSAGRAPFVGCVALLLSAFALPLAAAASAPGAGVLVGALIALGGLALQTVADVQKFSVKAALGPDALCRRGLWTLSRHPNYLGEIAFQAGVALAGVAGARSAGAALLACLAPGAFVAIMLGATKRLEAQQLKAYGDSSRYREYVKLVPRLFPRVGRLGAPSPESGTRAPPRLLRDEARETVADQEEEEKLAEEINSIVSVTAAAAWASVALGVLGSGLLS
jgi:steroid 5-alpha reductase family enzyme